MPFLWTPSHAAAVKPSFVFILIDDMGQRDLGCYGSTVYESPNVDRLAAQGMRFTDGYAACREDIGDAYANQRGRNRRPCGTEEHP